MQPNWNTPEELIGDLAWQTKINLAGRLPPLPSAQMPSCSHTDYSASRAGWGASTANSPALPPAFSLALQAPKHAQGQLLSTRQTGKLALPTPFGQLVDRQNGLLHSWEILGCWRPPCAERGGCDTPKLPWAGDSVCSTCRLLSASPPAFRQGTKQLFRSAVMNLFHLYFSKDLRKH